MPAAASPADAVKAAVYYRPGGPEVFRYEEVPEPAPGLDGVLIRVEAISVEGGDVLHRARGQISAAPHIVGYQAAGTVLTIGSQVTGFRAGDRVVTVGTDGSHAELRAVPEQFCWAIPPGLSAGEAACVPIACGTADDALFEFGRLQRGETVLVQAGAGGVGIAAIQLAKRAGARVLATASTEARLERLTELGLDHGINHATEDVVAEVMRLTGGRGVDLVFEHVGGELFQKGLDSLAKDGRLVVCGGHSGEVVPFDIIPFFRAQKSVIGSFVYTRDEVETCLELARRGKIVPLVHATYPLGQAREAMAAMERREQFGKIVLKP